MRRGADPITLPGTQGYFPWLSLIGVVLGTLVAYISVPMNPSIPGALRFSGLALALGMSVGPVFAAMLNLRNLLRAENILGLAPAYWMLLDLITGAIAMEGLSQVLVQKTFGVIGLATAMFWLGTMGRGWRLPKAFLEVTSFRPDLKLLIPIGIGCFFLGILRFAIPCGFDIGVMMENLMESRWSAAWARGAIGGWDAIIDHLAYFGYLLPTLAVMTSRRAGWLSLSGLLLSCLSIIFLIFLAQSGSRRIVGVCLGAALCCWILDRDRVRWQQLLVAGTVVGAILLLLQIMIVFRSVGLGRIGLDNASKIAVATIKGVDLETGAPKSLHVDDNFYRLSQSIYLVPERHPYVEWKYVFYVLVRPIPRALWKGKPMDGGFDLQRFDGKGASLSSTILGEFWISYGAWAVAIGGWLMGRASRMAAPLFDIAHGSIAPMFYGYISMTLFVGYRSLIEVMLFSYALVGWWAVTWVLRQMQR